MFGAIIFGVVGIAFVVLGCLIWKKEKISFLHSYHYDNVATEDKKAFCTSSGLGILFIGIGLLLTGIIIGFTDSAWSFISLAIGFIVGLAFLTNAEVKYNH